MDLKNSTCTVPRNEWLAFLMETLVPNSPKRIRDEINLRKWNDIVLLITGFGYSFVFECFSSILTITKDKRSGFYLCCWLLNYWSFAGLPYNLACRGEHWYTQVKMNYKIWSSLDTFKPKLPLPTKNK